MPIAEIAHYAFFGAVAWAGLILTVHAIIYLQLRIKTRKAVLDHIKKMSSVLEEGFREAEKVKRKYEDLIEAEYPEDNKYSISSKKLH